MSAPSSLFAYVAGRRLPRPAPRLVRRFSGTEIAVHWLVTLDAVLLTLSGLGLYLAPGANPVLDKRELMRTIHIDAALGLAVLPLVVVAVRPGSLGRLWHDVEWFDADDGRWLRRVWLPAPLRHGPLPAQGRFNAGQKLNTIALAAALVGFAVTGLLMDVGGHLPPSLADAADTWHLRLMLLCAPLLAGHVLLAVLLPSTRPALRGIVTGSVRADFAARRHARWMAGMEAVGPHVDESGAPLQHHPPGGGGDGGG